MGDIAKWDPNLAVETNIVREGLQFFDVEQEPFTIHGIFKEGDYFRRIPEAVARSVSEGVYMLHTLTTGGRVRFVTDSPYVAIKTEYITEKSPHSAITGSSGYDMYAEIDGDMRFIATFLPPFEVKNGYESVCDMEPGHLRIITINFPRHSSVRKLYIGLKEGSVLQKAPGYRIQTPVVYYGSSITHGGCASKPSSCYQNILSRRYGCDFINLGFGGNAKAEDEITEYICGLDMSAFVMDYDYNAPTVEHLRATHGRMFERIRQAHPEMPILILPRPKYYLTAVEQERQEVIRGTYEKALAAGDKNVYFISSRELMELVKDNGTVDNIHPTDSGFFSMALAISKVFDKIFK